MSSTNHDSHYNHVNGRKQYSNQTSNPYASSNPQGGSNNQSALFSNSPHHLSLKVMRISAPSLSTIDRPYFESESTIPSTSSSSAQLSSNLKLRSLPTSSTILDQTTPDSNSSLIAQSLQISSSDDNLAKARLALQNASASETATNETSFSSAISTGRDWNISSNVVLPSSFGTIFLGETFSVYLCLNNESNVEVANANLKIEMQVGDAATSNPPNPNQQSQNQPSKTLIGNISSSSNSTSDPRVSGQEVGTNRGEGGAAFSILSPSSKLETTVKHEMKELGPHVLVCSITYFVKLVNNQGQEQWVERDFRKYYKFSVPTSPLAVRTRATSQRSPNALLSPKASLRDQVFLDVSMENVGGRPLVIETLNLLAEDGWGWRSVDRPSIGSKDQPEGEEIISSSTKASDLWSGTSEYLLPNDMRQLLFVLYPLSNNLIKSIPPLPLGLGSIQSQSNSISQQSSSPNNPRPSFPRHSLSQQSNNQPPSTTTNIPLGKLDIAWRTGMGEVGRLQTSTLNRRKPFIPPVACQSDSTTSNDGNQFNQTIRRNPSPSQPFRTQRQPSNLGPSTPLQAPPPLPKDSPAIPSFSSALPPPLLETDLVLFKTPKDFEVQVEEPFEIGFQLWIRDLSLTLLNQKPNSIDSRHSVSSTSNLNGNRRPSGTETVISSGTVGSDSDDSDDDRPLSEIASPRTSIRGLDSNLNSPNRRFSTASNSSNPSTAANPYFLRSAINSLTNGNGNGIKRRKLIIGAQFLSIHPDVKTAASSIETNSNPQDVKPELSLNTNRKSLISGLSRASTISVNVSGSGSGPNTPLLDHRDPKSLSRSGSQSMKSGSGSEIRGRESFQDRTMFPNSPVPYVVRSSVDITSRTKSPPPSTIPTSYQVRQPSHSSSRPSTPTQSLTTQIEGLRSQATSPNPTTSNSNSIPPPPPPKGPLNIGLGPNPSLSFSQQPNQVTKPSHQLLPSPYFDSTSKSTSTLSSDHIVHEGSSFIRLDPIILSSEILEDIKGLGLGVGEAKIEFDSNFLPVEEGMARIGGLRILLLGWKDFNSKDGNDEVEKEKIGIDEEEEGFEWLRKPVTLREWESLGEVWVN